VDELELALSNGSLQVYIDTFRTSESLTCVNLDDGLEVDAVGFDERGEPITTLDNMSRGKYPIQGSRITSFFITELCNRGKVIIPRAGERIVLKGFDLLASYGNAREEIQRLWSKGIKKVFIHRKSSEFGMAESYGLFADSWIYSSETWKKEISYEMHNKNLKKLGSRWRVATPEIRQAIEYKQKMKTLKNLELVQ